MKSLSLLRLAIALPASVLVAMKGSAASLTATDRGPNYIQWQQIVDDVSTPGHPVSQTNTWIQLEDGLNYWDDTHQAWLETVEEIQITQTGAIARQGPHQAVFSSNVNDPKGALTILTANQAPLRSSVLALRYFDPVTAHAANLALIHNTQGELLPPNQVVYRDAFDNVRADVIYTYRKNGVEADVVLRESPPPPSDYGFQNASARLEVVTEFFAPPAPVSQTRLLSGAADAAQRAQFAAPDWEDAELQFGTHWLGQGRAFAWSARETARARPDEYPPVGKSWSISRDGRTFLVESVEYLALMDELLAAREQPRDRDPERQRIRASMDEPRQPAGPLGRPRSKRQGAGAKSAQEFTSFPARRPVIPTEPVDRPLRLSQVGRGPESGVVVDWTLVTSSSSAFTFSATNTYHVTGDCQFTGQTTIEGGTVVKFPPGTATFTGITLNGPVVCKTRAYRPAVFTSNADNTVGETIVAGSPAPNTDYGVMQLRFNNYAAPVNIQYLRFKYGNYALYFQGNNPDNLIRHCQFVQCRYPVRNTDATPVRFQNALIDGGRTPGSVFNGAGTPFVGEHLTIHNVPNLVTGGTLTLTNSLLIAISTVQNYSGSGNFQSASAAGIFEGVGGGNFYLASQSPHRNAGVSGISFDLASDLRQLTTEAPMVLGTDIVSETTLTPRAKRDTDVPDRGYHYPPLDYCSSGRTLAFTTLHLAGGVAIASFGSSGILLGNGARLDSKGLPNNLNRFVYYTSVQEQSTAGWSAPPGEIGLVELGPAILEPIPELRLTLTEATMPADTKSRRRLLKLVNSGPFSAAFSHSQFYGIDFEPAGLHPGVSIALTNNLMENSFLAVSQSVAADRFPMEFAAFNNLIRGGYVFISSDRNDSLWVLQDNLFDANILGVTVASGNLSNNGFRVGLAPFGLNNRTGLQMDFVEGPLGPYSYPSTGGSAGLINLVDAGSRSADAAGLFHFTATSDYVKETNSPVDIGFHYPAPAPPLTGLLGYWKLDELLDTTAADSSGNGHTGTLLNGPLWTLGEIGNALSFDGANDQVTVDDTPALRVTQGFTVAFWTRRSGPAADVFRYVGKGGATQRNFEVWGTAGLLSRLLLQFQDGAGNLQSLSGNRDLAIGQWYHVACTWDGATGRIYVDGQLDVAGPMPGPPRTSTDPLTFGTSGSLSVLPGLLDEISLYDRALSVKEVIGLMQSAAADSDADGLSDITEDVNGNGVSETDETSLTDVDTDYDGRSDAEEVREGTDPSDATSLKAVQLVAWTFDSLSDPWQGSNGAEPVERTAVDWLETAGPSVHGVGFNGSASVLRYREVELNGVANFNALQGTIQISFFPYWASPSSVCTNGNAGTGPGQEIELLSMGGFAIGIDSMGTNLFLRTPDGDGGTIVNVQTPFRACVNEYALDFPLEIQVAYSTNASAIFINNTLEARGSGVLAAPSKDERAQGLFIGSNPSRTGQVYGVIDGVLTYNVPLNLCTNALLVSATTTEVPTSIILNWSAQSNCYYKVERRSGPFDIWNPLASVLPPSFTDDSVTVGGEYEYRLSADAAVPEEFYSSTDPTYANILTGVRLPPQNAPGHILLVVDRSLTNNPSFESAVENLSEDLWAEGWVVARYNGPRHDDAQWSNNPGRIAEVKSWISAYYQANPGFARAVLLFGHLPVPLSGMLSPDGHPHRPLPADCYYGDLDGTWTDSTNWPAPPLVLTPNVAGDGIFDQELVPPNPDGVAAMELAVGRVDFANMPSFSSATPPRTEVDLLSQYVSKARRYRRRQVALPERVIYAAYFSSNAVQELNDALGQRLGKLAKRLEAAIAGPAGGAAIQADFFTAHQPAVWGIQGGFGGGPSQINVSTGVNDYYGITPHQTSGLIAASAEPPIAFSLVDASFAVQWNDPDHLGRGLMASRTNGLAWSYAGGTRIEWQYPIMALGKTLGDAWLKTQNDAWMWPLISVIYGAPSGTGVKFFTGSRSQGGYIFTTLLGDPTLRESPSMPPGPLNGTVNGSGAVVLNWGMSPERGARYHVFRSVQGVGGKWAQLTASPITTTSWTDPAPPAGTPRYLVRSLSIKRVASGSFTNESAGNLWP